MDDTIAAAKKEVLAEMVRLAQKREMKGSKGNWKEFLNFYDKKFGASLSDPSRRSHGVLLAFLKTFSGYDDCKFFAKVLQCYANRETVVQWNTKLPDDESSEQRLVRLTAEHPFYPVDFSFPSYEEDWVITRLRKKSKLRRSTEMVALDCEMVLCEDGSDALVCVCVVDRNLEVKLKEVVKPNNPVADYRTDITGFTEKDLDGVTCSLANVQKSLEKLLSHGTILVGHSLNNDLHALKMDHARVVDTSLIFKLPDQPDHGRPSLNNLCKSFLGYEVRKEGAPHNCYDDACAAMKLVLAKIGDGTDKGRGSVNANLPKTAIAKLLLYQIPVAVPSEELNKIFPQRFMFELKPKKKSRKEKYTAVVLFKSEEEAHEAFEGVAGEDELDSSGKPRKLVAFKSSAGKDAGFYVCELKNEEGSSREKKKRSSSSGVEEPVRGSSSGVQEEEALQESKKAKVELKPGNGGSCADHAGEIERLRRVVKEREEEISALHRIVASLARKQGL